MQPEGGGVRTRALIARVYEIKRELARHIGRELDLCSLSIREAARLLGLHSQDVLRIRHEKLDGFTVDRLLMILMRLGVPTEMRIGYGVRNAFKAIPAPQAPTAQDVAALGRQVQGEAPLAREPNRKLTAEPAS